MTVLLLGVVAWCACGAPDEPSPSENANRQDEHLLIPTRGEQGTGVLSWRLEVPDPPQADEYRAYQIVIFGWPGELVGLDRSAKAKRPPSDERFAAILVGSGRAADFQVELRQIKGRLAFELTTLIASSNGSNRSTLGVAWYCPSEVEYPLQEVRWVGPAGPFAVPEGGIDLLAMGDGSRVRIQPASDTGGFDEQSH